MQVFDKEKRILNFTENIDHAAMMQVIEILSERYGELAVTSIGKSILGRDIPMLQLGNGQKKVLYVGAHHGMEGMTTALLLRFINEYFELWRAGSVVDSVPVRALFAARSIYVIPMLNPDGVEYATHGVGEENPMRARVLSMNGGSEDFCRWQANARGVDLNHNYNAGFEEYKRLEGELGIVGGGPTRYSGEYPESEPEVAYLCNFLRFTGNFSLALTLHTQGEEIYYTSGGYCPENAERIGRYLARLCEYRPAKPDGPAAYGGFTDWFIREFDKPSFTVECGRGENPLPFSDFPMTYLRVRKMLFTAPMLI
ncbi:MAG: gamma-D-glutamyl-meso-diaminopimelate peptidase [Clostridia bacterium]|nr:gamma-D-glutamyl-meso-diaminopimelate peptidase [Clostridia bacterium]